MRRTQVSVQLVDKKSSDGHFRIELNAKQFCMSIISQAEDRTGGGGLMFAFSVALMDLSDPFGV